MPDEAPIEVCLAEYAALRLEIQNRSGLQQTLISLNVTAIAAIGGLVLSRHVSPAILLVLPPIAVTLGFLWVAHDHVIHDLGRYLRTQLRIWTPSRNARFGAQRRDPFMRIVVMGVGRACSDSAIRLSVFRPTRNF